MPCSRISRSTRKVVVDGITNEGSHSSRSAKTWQIASKSFLLEAIPEYKVAELLTKVEVALNLSLNIRDEIINDAQGSF
jgi:hypothetical protein